MRDITAARRALRSLTVYRNLLTDETVARFLDLLTAAQSEDAERFCSAYGAFYQRLTEQGAAPDFSAYLETLVRFDDNAFTRAAAAGERGDSWQTLRRAAVFDLEALSIAAELTMKTLKDAAKKVAGIFESKWIDRLPDDLPPAHGLLAAEPEEAANELERYHRKNGYGVFARYGAFRWEDGLAGVPNPDPVRLGDLKEYDYERGIVAANTEAFVRKAGGGNLLLYGDRGTGKSSTIKALANEYREAGLRIVEIPKDRIAAFPEITERLRHVPLRFVLFLDDLTFVSEDASFSALKSLLEGGIVARPENCLVYATSNRRHLIRELFSERDQDDVHAGDTMQEKLSLADRFDQTVNFFAPDQAKYLAIVSALANDRALNAPKEELERGAVQWAIRAGGRTPRTAKQFVDWAETRLAGKEAIATGAPE